MSAERQRVQEVPFIFSVESIRATDAGEKTQTRRTLGMNNGLVDGYHWSRHEFARLDLGAAWVDPGPSPAGNPGPYWKAPHVGDADGIVSRIHSRWWTGDLIYVREAIKRDAHGYAAFVLDNADVHTNGDRAVPVPWTWKRDQLTARNMPKYAARRWLQITDVRAERLQSISELDAVAEGVTQWQALEGWAGGHIVGGFQTLWDTLNGKRPGCRWADNPPAWVYTFRKLSTDEATALRHV